MTLARQTPEDALEPLGGRSPFKLGRVTLGNVRFRPKADISGSVGFDQLRTLAAWRANGTIIAPRRNPQRKGAANNRDVLNEPAAAARMIQGMPPFNASRTSIGAFTMSAFHPCGHGRSLYPSYLNQQSCSVVASRVPCLLQRRDREPTSEWSMRVPSASLRTKSSPTAASSSGAARK
jgi:hypothetical protein